MNDLVPVTTKLVTFYTVHKMVKSGHNLSDLTLLDCKIVRLQSWCQGQVYTCTGPVYLIFRLPRTMQETMAENVWHVVLLMDNGLWTILVRHYLRKWINVSVGRGLDILYFKFVLILCVSRRCSTWPRKFPWTVCARSERTMFLLN